MIIPAMTVSKRDGSPSGDARRRGGLAEVARHRERAAARGGRGDDRSPRPPGSRGGRATQRSLVRQPGTVAKNSRNALRPADRSRTRRRCCMRPLPPPDKPTVDADVLDPHGARRAEHLPRTSLPRRDAGVRGCGDKDANRSGRSGATVLSNQRAGLAADPEGVAHRAAGEGADEAASTAVFNVMALQSSFMIDTAC